MHQLYSPSTGAPQFIVSCYYLTICTLTFNFDPTARLRLPFMLMWQWLGDKMTRPPRVGNKIYTRIPEPFSHACTAQASTCKTKTKMQLTKQSASTLAKQHTCAAYRLPRCSSRAHLSVRAVVTPEKPKGSPTSAPSSSTAVGQSAVARGALPAELSSGAEAGMGCILG